MESFFDRYKNPLVLMGVLFVQIVLLATQVKRPDPKNPTSGSTRLIRVWAVTVVTPIERAFVGTGHFFRNGWHNYVDLHGVRKQNQELQAEITRLRLEQARLKEDAEQGRRLQTLVGFKEKFISQTMMAQVIGTSGSEQSHVLYIDKGSQDGVRTDMAVITPDGIVGKVKEVFPWSSQVLMINDRESGAGVILEKSRLQGILRGTTLGEMLVDGVMADQKVEVGDQIIASGGDRIYPKGLPVGTVSSVAPDRETGTFLTIKVKASADLNRLEEVLVITKMTEPAPVVTGNEVRTRAADILAQRLPAVPKADQQSTPANATPGSTTGPDQKKKPGATVEPKKQAGTSTGTEPGKPVGGNAAAPKPKPKKPSATGTQPGAPPPHQTQNQNPRVLGTPAVPHEAAKPEQTKTPAQQPPTATEKPPQ
jgi:rod shape-determining protein MreC